MSRVALTNRLKGREAPLPVIPQFLPPSLIEAPGLSIVVRQAYPIPLDSCLSRNRAGGICL